jgi:hypothetical protein
MGLDRTTDMRETSQINSEGAPMSRRSDKFSVLITATAVIELWVGSMVGSVAFAPVLMPASSCNTVTRCARAK